MAAMAQRTQGFGDFLQNLLGRTSLSSTSPFLSYGPAAAARPISRKLSGPSLEDDLRQRLASFVEGVVRPVRDEFVAFVKSAMVGLERRTYGSNPSVVVAVDRVSGRVVPAAAIDLALDHRAVQRAAGRNTLVDEMVSARAHKAAEYRSLLAPYLRDALDHGRAFDSWDDAVSSVSIAIKGAEITVVNGKSLVGPVLGRLTADEGENRRLLQRLSDEARERNGRDITLVHDEKMRPGMPIMALDGRTVRGSAIAPELEARTLDASFVRASADRTARARASLDSPRADIREIARARLAEADLDMRMATFEGRAAELAGSPASRGLPLGAPGAQIIRLADRRRDASAPAAAPRRAAPTDGLLVEYGQAGGGVRVVDSRTGTPARVSSPSALPDGRYAKEIWGMAAGFIEVSAGSVTHFSRDGFEENLGGPSFEPAPGSGERQRFALAGHNMPREGFDRALSQSREIGHAQFQKLLDAGRGMADAEFTDALNSAGLVLAGRRAQEARERDAPARGGPRQG